MADKTYEIDCSPECGFMVRSHDKQEVKTMAKEHVKTIHKMELTDADAEKRVQIKNA